MRHKKTNSFRKATLCVTGKGRLKEVASMLWIIQQAKKNPGPSSWISLKNGISSTNHKNLSRLLPTLPTCPSWITSDTDLPIFQDNAQAMELMMMEVLKQFVLLRVLPAPGYKESATSGYQKKSGQFCSDSTCPNWWSLGICTHSIAAGRRYGVLQSFVTWFSQAKKIPNITRLITSQVPAPRGR